jgi:hypothetical protein
MAIIEDMSARTKTSLIWIVLLLVSLLAGALASGGRVTAQGLAEPQVETALQRTLANGGQADFIIEMAGQADLSAAYAIQDWDERGRYVVDMLKDHASRSQAGILNALAKRGVKTTPFYAANVIYVHAGNSLALEAALRRPGIARVRLPVSAQLTPFSERLRALGPELQDLDTASISWGLEDTLATSFWQVFDVPGESEGKGEGIIVANIDTGVDYTHPALAGNYRCQSNPADPACWYDPSGTCLLINEDGSPCDNHGHGTHTIGTIAAENDPNLPYIVGMAPDAEWIACKGCILTDPAGVPITEQCPAYELLACGQWMLAPGGDPVNNSWGDVLHDTWYLSTVTAWRAAGIFPVFSAGNGGATCGSIGSPAEYLESFAVAAHDVSKTIALFSSRGPGAYGTFTKPNLSAPGVGIYSTLPGGTFGIKSGTSMSAPHLAGAVALLWSYKDNLIGNIDVTSQWLQLATDPPPLGTCGEPFDFSGNYTYGTGYLNVLAAGDAPVGLVKGHIQDEVTELPLPGAVIKAMNASGDVYSTLSNPAGDFVLVLWSGSYDLWATAAGYSPSTPQSLEIIIDTESQANFSLLELPTLYLFLPLVGN